MPDYNVRMIELVQLGHISRLDGISHLVGYRLYFWRHDTFLH